MSNELESLTAEQYVMSYVLFRAQTVGGGFEGVIATEEAIRSYEVIQRWLKKNGSK